MVTAPAEAATRFYLQNAAEDVTPSVANQGAWDITSNVTLRKMALTKAGAIATKAVAEAVTTSDYDNLLLKFVSEPITSAQTISGTVNWVIGSQESSNQMNAHWHVHAYVVSQDGTTFRGTLLTNYTEAAGTNEWPTTAVGDTPSGGTAITLTGVSAQANDRIVIEVGYVARNISSNTYTGTLWYGGTAPGDLTAGGDEATQTGWFEFSQTLFAPPTEVASSLGVSPEFGTFVDSPMTITEQFTSASAVNACQYTLNGTWPGSAGTVTGSGPYTCTASNVSSSNGTALTIQMRASNDGGTNWSTVSQSLARTVDSAAPTTSSNAPAGWQNASPVNVTLTPTDGTGSGVASTQYCVDTTNTCTPSITGTAVSVSQGAGTAGTQYVRYRSADNLSNLETTKSSTIQIDLSSPVTTDNAPVGWATTNVTVTLSPTDTGSGVAATQYCIDSADLCTPSTTGTSALVTTEGVNYVRYYSTDAVGNSETVKSATVSIDKSAPSTTDDAPAGWSTSSVTVTLTPSDAISGVASTQYCVDVVNSCIPSTAGTSTVVSAEGVSYVRYRSTDTAGNVEPTKSAAVQIDSSAPTVSADKLTGTYLDGVRVTLSCSDTGSGCSGIVYTTNGDTPVWPASGSTLNYSGPIDITVSTTLKFLAQDTMGNPSAVESISYTITPSNVRVAVAMGPASTNSSEVRVLNSFMTQLGSMVAFDGATVGYGARVAMGDIDGDGADEIIVGKGEGLENNSEVKAFKLDGTPVSGANVIPFSNMFRFGARVATGDFDGNGRDEIVVGTGEGQGLVRVFEYNSANRQLVDTGITLNALGAGADGVNVAVSDVDSDGFPELITTPASKTAAPAINAWVITPTGGALSGQWTASAHSTFAPTGVLPSATGGGAALAGIGSNLFVVGTGASGGAFEVYTTNHAAPDCVPTGMVDTAFRQRDGMELSLGDVDADGQPEIVVTFGAKAGLDSQLIVYGSNCSWEADHPAVFAGSTHGATTAVGRSN